MVSLIISGLEFRVVSVLSQSCIRSSENSAVSPLNFDLFCLMYSMKVKAFSPQSRGFVSSKILFIILLVSFNFKVLLLLYFLVKSDVS